MDSQRAYGGVQHLHAKTIPDLAEIEVLLSQRPCRLLYDVASVLAFPFRCGAYEEEFLLLN